MYFPYHNFGRFCNMCIAFFLILGLPAIIVIVTAAVKIEDYGDKDL